MLCPVLLESWQCYKFLINYIMRLCVKRFIPASQDPFCVLTGPQFAWTKFSHVIVSAHLKVDHHSANFSRANNTFR